MMKRERKTLVVEDSDIQSEMLELLLNDLGIEDVSKAVNGIRALELFDAALQDKEPYSLVLLDIVMPEMDGQEALKRMRALEKDAGMSGAGRSVIIMTTTLHSPNDMMESLIAGDCTDYIVKPLDENNLRVMLAKYGFI